MKEPVQMTKTVEVQYDHWDRLIDYVSQNPHEAVVLIGLLMVGLIGGVFISYWLTKRR